LTIAHSDLIAHDVTVGTNVGAELPTLFGDRVQLQQVLLNLILNACDAMDAVDRGKRRLSFAITRSADDGLRISVSDTGPGISAEQLPRIFEPFYTSKPQGLGLGLAICRSIVLAHGGRVWAESREGGATFHLALPVQEAHAAAYDVVIERPLSVGVIPPTSLASPASAAHPDLV
jgi:signal transduction histidine kinase